MTLKLYYSKGTCSLVSHIMLRETGLAFELEEVDIGTHKTANGEDFYAINAKGSVPVLEFADGHRLTEGPVIAQYICDLAGNRELMPEPGSIERYRVMEWQNYITSELHKFFWPLFHLGDDYRAVFREVLQKKFGWINEHLSNSTYLTGDTFSAADAYLFTILRWTSLVDVDISNLQSLQSYLKRIEGRPAVTAAMKAEGLL